ncbi:MAG: DUF2238 domain-containing protein [Patescibacteria group bacterium]
MFIKKEQIPLLIFMVMAIIFFTIIFSLRKNYEFLMYIGVIILFFSIVLYTNKKLQYPNIILWGLSFWAILHMSGGGLYIGGKKIYELILIPLVGEPYYIFRFDQFVHILGFGVATLIMYHLLKPWLLEGNKSKVAIPIVVVMAGLGVGALNEIVEFIATVIVPETGVGGYINTSLDLVSDLVGALIALIIIKANKFK